MKFCIEELDILKNLLADGLNDLCKSEVPQIGAKELAHLPLAKFESDGSVEFIKWCQIILRKIIIKMVDMNGN